MEREQEEESTRRKRRQPPQEEGTSLAVATTPFKRKPYRGVRMRKWGKWVAEVREPKKRSRLWLGTYTTAIAAARAYDTAVFYLYGSSARVNFPDLLNLDDDVRSAATVNMSSAFIREKAMEVGARVDALPTSADNSTSHPPTVLIDNPDLIQKP